MAQIRIVDDWRRSPAAGPSHYRSVMVIAEKWAEQRVLMRAFAESRDQLLPTILMHGIELAIGPAGLELDGPWGIHVGDNPEGRAQAIKHQLEAAARRLAGSKGNPPRLADEAQTFEREPTGNWGPGAPRIVPRRPDPVPLVEHVTPVTATRVPQVPSPYVGAPQGTAAPPYIAIPQGTPAPAPSPYVQPGYPQAYAAGSFAAAGYPAAGYPSAPVAPPPHAAAPAAPSAHAPGSASAPHRARSRTARHMPVGPARTALGYTSGAGAQSAIIRLGLAAHISARLGWLVDRVVPADFHVDARERRVLNALGDAQLTARGIGQMLEVADPVSFMEALTRKLESYQLGLIEPGEPAGGEPTYRLRC